MNHLTLSVKQINTCLTVVSSVSRFAITAITSLKIDTGGSIFARACTALVFICDNIRLRNQIQFSIYLLLQDEGGNNIHCTNHFYTWLAVVSSVSRFAVTTITSFKIYTFSSIFAWTFRAFIYVCKIMFLSVIFCPPHLIRAKGQLYSIKALAKNVPPKWSVMGIRSCLATALSSLNGFFKNCWFRF